MATDTTRDAAPAAHDIGSILNALLTQHTYLGGGWLVCCRNAGDKPGFSAFSSKWMTHVEKGAYKPLAHPRSGTKGCSARKVRFASARFKKAKGAAPSQLRKLRCLRPGENAPSPTRRSHDLFDVKEEPICHLGPKAAPKLYNDS